MSGTGGNKAINSGSEYLDDGNGNEVILPDFDMDYSDRIKDCRVDIGAYEYNGAVDIEPSITVEDEKRGASYYVTQNGAGTRSSDSPENAACWTKLQKVLDAAGR